MRGDKFDFFAKLNAMTEYPSFAAGLAGPALAASSIHVATVFAQRAVYQMLRSIIQSLRVDKVNNHRAHRIREAWPSGRRKTVPKRTLTLYK